ncbi:MAG: ribosome maturation factor RimM [bacterium]|nr:ribosome maturation factor RimM [bacterium]
MNYLYIGKIVNTHGIKGEIRIISSFEEKELVFCKNTKIYIGDNFEEKVIISYRHHKKYEMIMLKNYNNINDVLQFKGKKVYINRDDFEKLNNVILKDDMIGLDCFIADNYIGKVSDIYNTGNNNELIEIISKSKKKILIPFNKDFILSVDKKSDKIMFKKEVPYVEN